MYMGDDAVSRVALSPDEYEKRMFRELGVTLTDVTLVTPQDFEFCSHQFTNGRAAHLKPAKSLANVLMNGPGCELVRRSRLASLSHEWRYTPHRELYLEILNLLAPLE